MSRFALILSLAAVLASCAAFISPWVEADDWALRGEEAFRQGRYAEAEQHWQSALHVAERQGLTADAAGFRLNIARLDEARGDYASALRVATELAEYSQRKGYPALQARSLNVAALAQRRVGRYAESLATAKEAHRIAHGIGASAVEAESFKQIGAAHQAGGAPRQAYDAYRKGLVLVEAAGDRQTEAQLLNDLGGLHRLRAEYLPAKTAYERSLELRRKLGDIRGEGKVLGNLCILYQNLGDLRRALAYCESSLNRARASGDRALEANNLNNIGGLLRTLADYPQALAAYNNSLRVKRQLGDRAGEARALGNLGDLHRRQGDIISAVDFLNRSKQIVEDLEDPAGQSAVHYNLGWVYLDAHRYEDACPEFAHALGLQTAIGQPELLWRGFDGLSRCWQARSNPALAIFFGKQAVNTIQRVRTNIHQMEPELQRNFLRDKAEVYRRLADRLIDQGRLLEAQQVLAMLKEEEYFDFLRRGSEQDPRGTLLPSSKLETAKRQDYVTAENELASIGKEYAELRGKAELSPAAKVRLAALESNLRAARERHLRTLGQIESEFLHAGEQRAKEFGEKDLKSLRQLGGLLKGLKHRVMLIHYLVTEDRIRIIVTVPDPSMPPLHRDSPMTRADLNSLIVRSREKLENPLSDPLPDLKALYAGLIAPIEDDLAASAPETLMVSLDQALRYVPYAALHDGAHHLTERYGLAMYTVWAKATLSAAPNPDWRVAGLGVSKAAEGFPALPAVRSELDAIVLEGGADHKGVLPGHTYVDEAFTAKQFSDVLREGYPLVHLASHFHFEPAGTDESSYLLLGDGKRLTLHELQVGDYPLSGVELLTFSACETALSGNDADGREVESFGMLAQQQGAQAVLATLWKVADIGTAEFMTSFYLRRQQHPETTKAEALRQTQLAFIRGGSGALRAPGVESRGQVLEGSSSGSETPPPAGGSYRHPYYWAPFVLMGNWL